MDSDAKSKIKKYVFSLVAIVFILFVCIVTLVTKGLNDITSLNEFSISSLAEKNNYLQLMRLSFERTRGLSNSLMGYEGDLERIEKIKMEMVRNTEDIDSYLSSYTQSMNNSPFQQEQDMLKRVTELLSIYNDQIFQRIELGMAGDPEAMEAALMQIDPLVMEVNSRFQEMSDYNQAQLMESVKYSIETNNTTVSVIIVASVIAFAIIVTASALVFSATMKILSSLSNIQDAQGYVQSQYKSGFQKDEGLLLSELERCVSDLKAVAYDLSKSTKELKK